MTSFPEQVTQFFHHSRLYLNQEKWISYPQKRRKKFEREIETRRYDKEKMKKKIFQNDAVNEASGDEEY